MKTLLNLSLLCILIISSTGAAESSPAALSATQVVPQGPNFQIMDNTGGSQLMGKPAIAFDGTNFLIGWYDGGSQVLAARVTQEGKVLDPGGIVVSNAAGQSSGPPSVIFDGTYFRLVFYGLRNEVSELYTNRVTTGGSVLDGDGIQVTTGGMPKLVRKVGLAYDGTNVMVVWRTDYDDVRGARISSTGANLDGPDGFLIAGLHAHYYPSVAYGGGVFLVTWHDGRGNPYDNLDIYGARVKPDGAVLDPNGFPIDAGPYNQDQNTVAFNGQNFWVVWYDQGPTNNSIYGRAYGARVKPDGTVLDTPPVQISDWARGQIPPQITCPGETCLVVWSAEYHSGDRSDIAQNFRLSDVFGRRLKADGTVLDDEAIPVSTSIGHQFGPAIGWGGNAYLVAWNDSTGARNYAGAIWGQFLTEQEAGPAPLRAVPVQPAETWEPVNAGSGWYLSNGLAFDSQHAQVFGDRSRMVLENGVWTSESIENAQAFFASWGALPDDVWAGGWCRSMMWLHQGTVKDFYCLGSGAGDANLISGLWGIPGEALWASADRAKILKHSLKSPEFNDWTTQTLDIPYDLQDIWGTSAVNIYAVGERGIIMHFDGQAWQPAGGVPTIQTLNAIWGSGPSDIFAVGDWGVILHYDGSRWTQQASGTTHGLTDVWGTSGKDVYAVGLKGAILHYDGSGWRNETLALDSDFLTVFGALDRSAGKKVVWAAGGNSVMYRTEQAVYAQYLPEVRKP